MRGVFQDDVFQDGVFQALTFHYLLLIYGRRILYVILSKFKGVIDQLP